MKKYLLSIFVLVGLFVGILAQSTIVVGTTDKIRTLDPALCYDYFSSNILQNVLAGPVDYKVNSSEIVPNLFESWEVSEDGLEYTFHVKKGVVFEDGTPIDANVFKFSFDRVIKLGGDPAFLLSDVVKSTEVVDNYTFKVTLLYPFSAFVSVLGYTVAWPVNPKVFPADKFYDGVPSSSGPYKVTEWIRDVRITLRTNERYFGQKPKTDRIIIQFYENASTLRLALETGEIDIAFRHLDPRDILDLKNSKNLQVIQGESPQVRMVVFNVQKPPFNDPLVRQAISQVIDRHLIVEEVFQNMAAPLYSLVPMGMWSHEDVFQDGSVETAKQLLYQAGYNERNKLVIDLWYSPTHYGTTEADVAQVLMESLEKTGIIDVRLQYAEWATYVDYFLNGNMGMFLLGWYPDYIDPDDYLWPFMSESGAKSMGSFYVNPYIEAVMRAARVSNDQEARTDLYHVVQQDLAVSVPYVPLWQGVETVAAKTNIKGILLEPSQVFRYYLLYKE
ncbi:ABC transporter substrate-binding protein [Petrotoga sp. 9PWA.NaAc.5.4]|uniref:ABC transporter substrate-binding protein n=1 Tax=Petrotoga sp. 9PWA.NaAc.5.4 TaxID=1434328 RepID=UPI000CC5631A|nr:ABC transporter substrate-binding protein [Petrotoga sp. 9PWA.NaAc.5.4]PNR96302.1 peptide ABC transporter substrate-binding protein [Petrotoga sp. 9PWA.NaAc.5.4]